MPEVKEWSIPEETHKTIVQKNQEAPTRDNNAIDINADFQQKVKEFKTLLSNVKTEFSDFDEQHPDRLERINFVQNKKTDLFIIFNKFFSGIWQQIQPLDKKAFKLHQQYYQATLGDPLLEAEINKYIKEKPLGYPGDYRMMNYIYDHQHDFVGETSLKMLINHYTANIPISHSNIRRKDYFKQKIFEFLELIDRPRIASVGCGSARELIELVEEGKITKPLVFTCLDFEAHALKHIEERLAGIDEGKKKFLKINYHQVDIRAVIKNDKLITGIGEQDLVYASGLFDYLGDYLAQKILPILFKLVCPAGLLIIVNASQRNSEFRSYYEMLGDWRFFHRSEEELLAWTKSLDNAASLEFEEFSFPMNYLFLLLKKKT